MLLVAVTDTTAYRYLRYSTGNGFANVAELEILERTVDRTLLELLLDRAALLDGADWTADSWAALTDAVETAENPAADADQDTVDGSIDALDAALDGLAWNVPDWNEATVYRAGARVAYDGRVFVAQWYSRGQVPGESPYSAWAEVGERSFCGGAVASAWTASTVYEDGDEAVFDGSLWRAKWWTRNQEPGGAYGPWEPAGDC